MQNAHTFSISFQGEGNECVPFIKGATHLGSLAVMGQLYFVKEQERGKTNFIAYDRTTKYSV